MKILRLYESILNEAGAEACVNSFGKELFGQELGGKEPDTDLEKKYVRLIDRFTDSDYGVDISPYFVKALENLKGCMKQYPEVLIPEMARVYRGEVIPIKDFINQKLLIDLTKPISYIYKAPNKIQSWSANPVIAATFGRHDILNEISSKIDFSLYNTPKARQELLQLLIEEDLNIGFILEYKSNKNEFIFKSKYFKLLSGAHHEDELIRIDNKPINVLAKFNDSPDVFLTRSSLMLIKYINKAISES